PLIATRVRKVARKGGKIFVWFGHFVVPTCLRRMSALETKQTIQTALADFAGKPLADAATALFESLGYKSQKRIVLNPNTAKTFTENFAKDKPLNPDHVLLADWQSVDFLFQLTDEEVRAAAQHHQQFLFESKGKYSGTVIESYLLFAITLKEPHYTRTELSGITRAVSRFQTAR
ncbi:MAG: hypothetical protein ABI651_22215, partial [Verrucomicrobiota bacterium]